MSLFLLSKVSFPQPVQYKLTSKLSRLLGLHTAKRPDIINAVWQYINVGALKEGSQTANIAFLSSLNFLDKQASGSTGEGVHQLRQVLSTGTHNVWSGKESISVWSHCNYAVQIFEVPRMKFTEIPRRLQPLLAPPDPIVIHHLVKWAIESIEVLAALNVVVVYFVHSADAPEGKRTACYDVELEIVSLVENFFLWIYR